MKIKLRFKDLISPSRWKYFSLWILKIFNRYLSEKIDKMDNVVRNSVELVEVGKTITLTPELVRKIELSNDFEQVHIIEQYMYRFLSCNVCLQEGECINCHCKTLPRMLNRSDKCSMNYWEAFKDEKTWNKWKEVMGLSFKLNWKNK